MVKTASVLEQKDLQKVLPTNQAMSGVLRSDHIVFGMDHPVLAGMTVSRMAAHGPEQNVRCHNLVLNQMKPGVPNRDSIVYGINPPALVGMTVSRMAGNGPGKFVNIRVAPVKPRLNPLLNPRKFPASKILTVSGQVKSVSVPLN